jgi:hypothetical protein
MTYVKIPVYQVNLPKPPIGNKIFCAQGAGFYVLERKPATWRSCANTHQGTGSITVYDGIPDEDGHFHNEPGVPEYMKNGRLVFNANPPILGMWMFDGGMYHGLTLGIEGVMNNISPCLTITWMEATEQKRKIEQV